MQRYGFYYRRTNEFMYVIIDKYYCKKVFKIIFTLKVRFTTTPIYIGVYANEL